MRKIIYRIAGLLLIGAAFFAACSAETTSPESLKFPVEKQAQFTATLDYALSTLTATATVPATPTPYDYRATEFAISDIEAKADAARAQLLLDQTAMTAEAGRHARATAEESERLSKELDARIVLAYGNATATAQVWQGEQELAAQELAMKARWSQVGIVTVWAVIGLILWLGISVGVRILRSVDYRESGRAQTMNQMRKPLPRLMGSSQIPAAGSWIATGPATMRPGNVPVSDKAFRVWANVMLADGAAGENNWTTKDSPFTVVSYPPFLEWAESQGYVAGGNGLPKS